MGFGKDGKGTIIKESVSIVLGALGQQDVVVGAGPVITEDFRIIKTEVWGAITGLTSAEADGLYLGIANGDLNAGEIEESLEANGPLFPGQAVEQERAGRLTKMLGQFIPASAANDLSRMLVGPDGGAPVSKTIRWTFGKSQGGWNWFVHNVGTVLTTGATLRLSAVHYGVWVV